MGNGVYGQCGHRGQWGTGDMGHMGNEAHRGKVVQGMGCGGMRHMAMRPTGGMGYRVWAIGAQGVWGTWGMGHIINRSHSQWATWAMGLMGHGAHGQWSPWVIGTFLLITSLILDGFLQKILLDIDINIFYLNTG